MARKRSVGVGASLAAFAHQGIQYALGAHDADKKVFTATLLCEDGAPVKVDFRALFSTTMQTNQYQVVLTPAVGVAGPVAYGDKATTGFTIYGLDVCDEVDVMVVGRDMRMPG